jgi:hypothetical protein
VSEELIGCLGWSLQDDEVAKLESAAELLEITKK